MSVALAVAVLIFVCVVFSCSHGANSYEESAQNVGWNQNVLPSLVVDYEEDVQNVGWNPVEFVSTGLPVLYLELDRAIGDIDRGNYVQGTMRLVYADGTETFEYKFNNSKEGIKGRGNSSWNQPKKSYSIKFEKKQEFFGLPKAKKWCLIANYSDKTLLRNKFASVLGNDVLGKSGGEWNPHFEPVDVVVNGEYRGNYLLGERITLTDGRVEVEDISKAANLADGGFVLEVDFRHDAEFWFDSNEGVPFTLKDPDDVSDEIKNIIKNIVNTAEAALYGEKFTDEMEGYAKYLDVDSFIDWYIVNEYAKNRDAIFYTSVYMYYNPTDRKLHMGPNWDFDIGFGNDGETDCGNADGWYIRNAKWISRLFQDPAFVAKVKARWYAVRENIYYATNTTFLSLADKNKASAELNFKCWQILGIYIWPNSVGYATRTTYQSEVDWMIDWLNKRYAWIDSAIDGL